MIAKCSKCGALFEAKGYSALEVVTGGKQCPKCGGNVNIVVAKKKKHRKS